MTIFRSGIAWIINVDDGSWHLQNIRFAYESTDCTGTPYIEGIDRRGFAFVRKIPAVTGDPVYIPVLPATQHSFQSAFDVSGCQPFVQNALKVLSITQIGTLPPPRAGPLTLR